MKVKVLECGYLEEADEKLLHIESLIEKKREMLFKKQRHLENIQKKNNFLHDIYEDYKKYNTYILKQKQDQQNALELLQKYLEDLQKSDSLSENNIYDAQQEQRKVMRELQILKKNIHKIIQYTGDIQSTLVEKKII